MSARYWDRTHVPRRARLRRANGEHAKKCARKRRDGFAQRERSGSGKEVVLYAEHLRVLEEGNARIGDRMRVYFNDDED